MMKSNIIAQSSNILPNKANAPNILLKTGPIDQNKNSLSYQFNNDSGQICGDGDIAGLTGLTGLSAIS